MTYDKLTEKVPILEISVAWIKSAIIEEDGYTNTAIKDYPNLCNQPADIIYEFIINDLCYTPVFQFYDDLTKGYKLRALESLFVGYLKDTDYEGRI